MRSVFFLACFTSPSAFRNRIQVICCITVISILLPASVVLLFSDKDHHGVVGGTTSYQRQNTSSTSPTITISVVLPTSAVVATESAADRLRHWYDVGDIVHPALERNRLHPPGISKPRRGGIHFRSIARKKVFARQIPAKEYEMLSAVVKPDPEKYSTHHSSDRSWHYDEIDYPKRNKCYKPTWAYEVYPSCNNFHELPLNRNVNTEQTLNVTYLGRGHFRSGWLVADAGGEYDLALKTIRHRDDEETVTTMGISMTQVEAVTMLATAGSNRTTNIYGHCSTSVMVERGETFRKPIIPSWGWRDQKKLDKVQVDDVHPANNYTAEDKLKMSLVMAESLADMHGNVGGVIVNNDLSLSQWIFNDGIIKLNDFNKAHIMQWNPEEQQYCPFWSHQSLLQYAPEEFVGSHVDESSDVNSFGKIMYMILTGLKPYYHLKSHEKANPAIVKGAYPYVDPRFRTRSTIERRLVEIMEKTWKLDPTERPSIFSVVEELRETARTVFGVSTGAGFLASYNKTTGMIEFLSK